MTFTTLITLEPLGLLYGSSGRFLSAENLTGKAGEHFPPDSPTLAGLVAAQLPADVRRDLVSAGPFWIDLLEDPDPDLRLPAPLCLLQDPEVMECDGLPGRHCRRAAARLLPAGEGWLPEGSATLPPKPEQGGWVRLSQWQRLGDPGLTVELDPWKAVPHLHPRLQEDQRCSAQHDALFLELGIALAPGVALAYLCSHAIPDGRYRFGGEGHLVELRCLPVPPALSALLEESLKGSFALITPGVWGSSRLSMREPLDTSRRPALCPWHRNGEKPLLLTDRPRSWRHRLGGGREGIRRLSRGRWAVPPGSCYALPPGQQLPPWPGWPESWFPREGLSLRHFGTALALPLP